VLVLVAIMYVRLFGVRLLASRHRDLLGHVVAAVAFSRGIPRSSGALARRHGYNLRYAVIVGGGRAAAEVLRVLRRRPDVGNSCGSGC